MPSAPAPPPAQTNWPTQFAPVATHCALLGSQQSGALQAVPVRQHGFPVRPQVSQVPAALEQTWLAPEQAAPAATQAFESQQPDGHELPGQHWMPVVPHAWQEPPMHAVLAVEHAPLVATHLPSAESQQPPALHGVAPVQQE